MPQETKTIKINRDNRPDYLAMLSAALKFKLQYYFDILDYTCVNGRLPSSTPVDE